MDESADWCVDCSDDENKYGANGAWEPSPEEIVSHYEALARGEELVLDWKCPGRRVPQTGKKSKPAVGVDNAEKISVAASNVEVTSPSGYEFDADDNGAGPVTPSRVRIPGKTPKSAQKRVARFDRVINDINRQKLGSPVASPDSPSAGPLAPSMTSVPTPVSTTAPGSAPTTSKPQQSNVQQQMQQLQLQKPVGLNENETSNLPQSSPQQLVPS